jgi:hypothetical protein
MIDALLTLRGRQSSRPAALATYLDAASEERAHEAAYAWIKSLRHLTIDGTAFRDRFTVRNDSLWWFTELYLHKQQTVLDVHRAIFALGNLFEREEPRGIELRTASPAVAHIAHAFLAKRATGSVDRVKPVTWLKRLAALDARARTLTLSSLATRDRWRRVTGTAPALLAAFVHRAFWRRDGNDGAAESYVGPVLAELERRLEADAIRYIGVGPGRNFRTHRRLRSEGAEPNRVVPVERFAPPSRLEESRVTWRLRYNHFRQLTQSPSIRAVACIEGLDCWPILREELAGIAWLQWPWSVRAMDEAAAALEMLRPQGVLTYAEAGGWGRALVLEARRRGIPSVGLQHGFIYRHWLNYRHEADEMRSTATNAFPLPTKTLLFDRYAAKHLTDRGRFPPDQLHVTGSPGLDELVLQVRKMPSAERQRIRQQLGVAEGQHVVLVATKEREARAVLPPFLDAAATVEGAFVVVKPHPAESADVYEEYLRNRSGVGVADRAVSLGQLLAVARAVVTVNSTVALDAGALGVPALSIGLPNNLSPFVEAGAMAGASDTAALRPLLQRILYDEGFRQQLAARRLALFGSHSELQQGSASRSADAVLELIRSGCVSGAGQEG